MASVFTWIQFARGFRGDMARRAWRQHQACRVRGGRGFNCDLLSSSSTSGV